MPIFWARAVSGKALAAHAGTWAESSSLSGAAGGLPEGLVLTEGVTSRAADGEMSSAARSLSADKWQCL